MAIPVNDKLVTVEGLKAGLNTKPNATDVYEKTETYTKTEVDDAIQQSMAKATVQGLTGAASGITLNGTLTYDKVANTVRIYLSARSNSDITTSSALAFVPTEYKPKANARLVCMVKTSSDYVAVYSALISTTGKITQDLSASAREVLVVGEYSLE